MGCGLSLDRRFDAVDAKLTRQLTWLVGVPMTILATAVGAILAR